MMLELIIFIGVLVFGFSFYTNRSQTKLLTKRAVREAAKYSTASAVLGRDLAKLTAEAAKSAKTANAAKEKVYAEVLKRDDSNVEANLRASTKEGLNIGESWSFGLGIKSAINDVFYHNYKQENTQVNREEVLKNEQERLDSIKKSREELNKSLSAQKADETRRCAAFEKDFQASLKK